MRGEFLLSVPGELPKSWVTQRAGSQNGQSWEARLSITNILYPDQTLENKWGGKKWFALRSSVSKGTKLPERTSLRSWSGPPRQKLKVQWWTRVGKVTGIHLMLKGIWEPQTFEKLWLTSLNLDEQRYSKWWITTHPEETRNCLSHAGLARHWAGHRVSEWMDEWTSQWTASTGERGYKNYIHKSGGMLGPEIPR